VKIAFTEWLFNGPAKQVPRYDNLGGALAAAGFLNTVLRVADFTPIADMTGLIEFGGVWQNRAITYGVPAYWAFRMYSTADATRLVSSTVKVETYDVEQGVRRIPSIPAVPYLDVAAALNADGSRLTLFCVNRAPTRAVQADVAVSGFAARTAKGQQLTAPDLYAVNDADTPEAVVPAVVTVETRDGGIRHSFPPRSVTVIELAK